MANPVVKLRQTNNKQLRQHHASSRAREPLKISARQQAQLLWEQNRLSDRDINLIRGFIAVGMLTRHQIQRIFFRDHEKMAANRLARLYHQYFLDRTLAWGDEMRAMGLPACYIYTANRVGLEAYALCTGARYQQVPFNRDRYLLTRQNHKMLHDLQISEMFTRLQVGMQAMGWEMTWFNEWAAILRQEEEELVRPDGVAILERARSDMEVGYFIEMDRGNTDWQKKIAFYDRAYQRSAWRQVLRVTDYPAVLCVVVSEWVEAEAIQIVREKRPITRYLFKTWERFLAEDVYQGWLDPVTANESGLIG
ncbi:MAG: replication-relaxation family protein [Chloroflexi bacterium]|nr:replication-relaxation family protein [Chloroflexota bacterium]